MHCYGFFQQNRLFRGFSLIELLIVVALIGILGLASVPSFRLLAQSSHSRVLCENLRQAMEGARLMAVVQGEDITLCGTQDGRHCSKDWSHGWISRTANGKVLAYARFQAEKGNVRFRLFPRGRFMLSYFASGWPDVENGTFWYCPAGWESPAWALVLNRFGRIRLLPPSEIRGVDIRC